MKLRDLSYIIGSIVFLVAGINSIWISLSIWPISILTGFVAFLLGVIFFIYGVNNITKAYVSYLDRKLKEDPK